MAGRISLEVPKGLPSPAAPKFGIHPQTAELVNVPGTSEKLFRNRSCLPLVPGTFTSKRGGNRTY